MDSILNTVPTGTEESMIFEALKVSLVIIMLYLAYNETIGTEPMKPPVPESGHSSDLKILSIKPESGL